MGAGTVLQLRDRLPGPLRAHRHDQRRLQELCDDRLALGYCGGPAELIAAMATIQGQSTSNASSISQKAATVALNGPQDCVAEFNRAFKVRHDLVVEGLNALPGMSCLPGWGTFYAFPNVEQAMRIDRLRRTTMRSQNS